MMKSGPMITFKEFLWFLNLIITHNELKIVFGIVV